MGSGQLLFFVILPYQMLLSVLGQPSIGCFVVGECMDSLTIGGTSISQGDLQCPEYCTTVNGSNYFSCDPQNSVSVMNTFFQEVLPFYV